MAPQFRHHDSPAGAAAAARRAQILTSHLVLHNQAPPSSQQHPITTLTSNVCLSYSPPELSETISFDPKEMRRLLDGHHIAERDWLFGLIEGNELFNPVRKGGKVYVMPDVNQPFQQQREMNMKRIKYLFDKGVHKGFYTEAADSGAEAYMRNLALQEVLRTYDLTLGIQMGLHLFLWGSYVKFLGSKHHQEKWLKATESYEIIVCIAMSELGHGSNLQAIETVATYDSSTEEFVVNTPCESAQKHMIGLAANYATHALVFAQLHTNGRNQGLHAFVVQIRDANGRTCPKVRIEDCGPKNGLNAIDNGQIWFDNVRIPRENLLNGVADVLPDGQYVTKIKDPRERHGQQLAPLTIGRVIVSTSSIYKTKVSLAIAIRYALSRRAFSVTPNGPEVLLLDYPSHQRRLLPLLAKTYAMSFAGNWLKLTFTKREPQSYKAVVVFSVAFKAIFTWHSMRTLQECREACGAQGMKAVNRLGLMVAESDAQLTYEGDNNLLLQQVSRIVLTEFLAAKKHKRPLKEFGLEHMNEPSPVIPSQLSSSILRSSQFQIAALRLRERDLLHRFSSEVSKHQFWGETKDQAINLAYHLYKELSKAFTERMILQLTIEAEESISAGPIKDVLALVRSLYALICIEEDDTFLRYGHLSAENAATVREEVTKLCSELRPHALALVSSFGIPDSFLAPIAFDWVEANSWSSVSGGH
ncbi:Acyl-coenzyme A oxidase 3, peroxisomal [Turnera subulata]|uniref:Acyl-coenzyme A oxidase n=1 Tax=Turnera subulata TaxID=218843 RepID=A0A9Q0FRW2_9ROSI|nr:Acyl-coenzyme A oxidase 3, peroxisomal [Turnera subulata]